MEGVEEVRQLDDTRLHWRTKVGGREQEFDAEITEQRPDERIAWTATQGAEQAGVVTFHRVDDARTKVMLQLDAEPEGVVEKVGDAARRAQAPRQGRPRALQGAHRGARHRERRLARRGGSERHALNVPPCPGARPSHPR